MLDVIDTVCYFAGSLGRKQPPELNFDSGTLNYHNWNFSWLMKVCFHNINFDVVLDKKMKTKVKKKGHGGILVPRP